MALRPAEEFPTPAFRLASGLALVAAVVVADVLGALVLWGENGWIYPVVVGVAGVVLVPAVMRAQTAAGLIVRLVLLLVALVVAHVVAFAIWAATVQWE